MPKERAKKRQCGNIWQPAIRAADHRLQFLAVILSKPEMGDLGALASCESGFCAVQGAQHSYSNRSSFGPSVHLALSSQIVMSQPVALSAT